MANQDNHTCSCNNQDQDESSPLLNSELDQSEEKDSKTALPPANTQKPPKCADPPHGCLDAAAYGWTADGVPLSHGSVVGEPMARNQWDSSLIACLGRNDEFCSSDLEVCLLGSVAPCVLYGSNAERIGSGHGVFASNCLYYSGLYMIGYTFFGNNFLAPWFTYPTRTAIRRKFNLEGTCESLHRSYGCCGSLMEDEDQHEQCELACDFATHVFCHACALCQEGREVRRRVPHPGLNARQVLVMIPPGEQSMGRGI